ncbi:MAG: PAS domain S-box protein, partial [Spirochaetota bacterium]|nr:PAS domain S-box protein [Spirochaetota bacterium]
MRESLEAIIIDDNPADARILSRYLEELSLWEVSFEVVSKGEDAMSRTKEKDFDVAFVDYQLGKETGIDIIRSLKESGCHMGFVLLTGMSSEGVILEALREGAEDYIAKDNLSVESLDRCIRHIMKRKEAEEALIESEERFRTMFDQAAVGIALIDMDGKWIRVNQKLLGIVGYSFEELKSFSFLDLTYRDDWTALLRGVESLRRGKLSTFTMEKRHILSDGAISWTNVTISLMRGDRGKASYYLTVIEDINKRKQTEMALRKSEANLVYAQQIAQLGNWVWDIITDIHHWSNEIFRIFGMIPQQIDPSFESFMEVVHPDDREIVKASIDKALSDHVCFNIEHRIILPDGKIRIVVERGDVFYGENGEALQMISTVQDITKRKETEESLRLSAKVLDSTSEGILITDRNANILDVNDSFTRITGYSPEEVIGNNPRLMKSGKHDTNFYKSMWDSLKNDGFWQGEIWDRRKSGEIYPKWMSINEVQDDSGEVTHYVAIFSD